MSFALNSSSSREHNALTMPAAPQNQPTAGQPTFEQSYRMMRIVHAFFLLSIVLYVGITVTLARSAKPLAPTIPIAVGAVAVSAAVIALFIRSRSIGTSEETLRIDPGNPGALMRWRAGQITSLALAESIVLHGLVLKFIGAEWTIAGLFFAAGAALMVIFTPQRP